MIDLHCHILPRVDDGAQNLTEAVAMAKLAVNSGVTAVAATPHCVDGGSAAIREQVLLLREALEEMEIPLRLYMGMEIFGTENTARLLRAGKLMTLNNSQYPLIEFDFQGTGMRETRILQDVLEAGFIPVVAHPERYSYAQERLELMNRWTEMGCLMQVNRGSLFGRFGAGARELGLELVRRGFASAVASDAHSPRARTPWMQDVQELIGREVSLVAAEYLLNRNPKKILKNQPLDPVVPEWF